MNIPTLAILNSLVSRLNTQAGYTTRYRLFAIPGSRRAYALMKAVGDLESNVTGYLSPRCMKAYLEGHIEGYDSRQRREKSEQRYNWYQSS